MISGYRYGEFRDHNTEINLTEARIQQMRYPQWINVAEVVMLLFGITLALGCKPIYYGYWIFYQIVYFLLYGLCLTGTIRFIRAPGIFIKQKPGRSNKSSIIYGFELENVDTSFRFGWFCWTISVFWIVLAAVFFWYESDNQVKIYVPENPTSPRLNLALLQMKCNKSCSGTVVAVFIIVTMVACFVFSSASLHNILEEFFYVLYLTVFPIFIYTLLWGVYIPLDIRPETAEIGNAMLAVHGLVPLPMTLFLAYFIYLEKYNAKHIGDLQKN